MNESQIATTPTTLYYRLIAVWVICEAMLGGIIHGFRIPVSGLVVGSAAVICICLIAWYVPARGAILKATIIVAIFKMMLSPQAPPPAYIAVFFQGVMGEILFRNKKYFRLSCLLLAIAALLESGLQRILVLTIVYGNDLWIAINDFIGKLTKQKNITNYSWWIGVGYVGLHLVVGILVGWIAGILPRKIEGWTKDRRFVITTGSGKEFIIPGRKKKRLRPCLFIVWLVLIALYIQSYFEIGTPWLPSHISLKIFLRSLIIVFTWIFIVGPLLRKLLHKWLEKKKQGSQQHVAEVLRLLPTTQELLTQSWKRVKAVRGFDKLKGFVKTVLVNALSPTQANIYILTGPIGSGKTTSLIKWAADRNDVYGILSPVVNGKRVFMNAGTKEQFQMEAKENETDVLAVGRFVFSKQSFNRAEDIIRQSIDTPGWLIIDEIGPMELRGEGFYAVLKEVLARRRSHMLLVVREGMDEQVKDFFKMEATTIRDINIDG